MLILVLIMKILIYMKFDGISCIPIGWLTFDHALLAMKTLFLILLEFVNLYESLLFAFV